MGTSSSWNSVEISYLVTLCASMLSTHGNPTSPRVTGLTVPWVYSFLLIQIEMSSYLCLVNKGGIERNKISIYKHSPTYKKYQNYTHLFPSPFLVQLPFLKTILASDSLPSPDISLKHDDHYVF